MKLWRSIFSILLVSLSFSAWAEAPILNKIRFQLAVEDWVVTERAKVIVSVDATLTESRPDTFQKEIQSDLASLGKGEWKITHLERRKDETGLEKVRLFAEARLPEAALSEVNKQIHKLNRAGKQFRIADVQFLPTLSEVEAVQARLREQIYRLAQEEITRLNKLHPQVEYFIHEIYLTQENLVEPVAYLSVEKVAAVADALAVNNKVTVRAEVIIAAVQKQTKNSNG